MSLVGTRPILPDELEQYELHHRARIAIKPGITGMWQVSGRSDITDFEEIVRLDTEYISEWNINMDFNDLVKRIIGNMEDITGDYKTLIEKCVAFAAQFICIPPTELLFDDCPSNRFPTMSNAAESSASIVLGSDPIKINFRIFQ